MHWLWVVLFILVLINTSYSLFYKEFKTKSDFIRTNDIADLAEYIDTATEKPINFALFIISAIVLLDYFGVMG